MCSRLPTWWEFSWGLLSRPFADPEHEAFSPGLHVDGFPVFPFLRPAEP